MLDIIKRGLQLSADKVFLSHNKDTSSPQKCTRIGISIKSEHIKVIKAESEEEISLVNHVSTKTITS